MLPKSLSSLVDRSGGKGRTIFASILGSLIGLVTPLLALLLGGVLNCLITATAGHGTPAPFAVWLPDLGQYLSDSYAPLAKVCILLGTAFVLLALSSLVLFLFYRQLQIIAVAFEVALIEQLRLHSKRLATTRTLSAQQRALTDGMDYHLPRVRSSLSRWWQTFPRHAVQLLACVIVAVLVQPILALLTLIATGLAILVYRFVDGLRRRALPVVRERAAQHRGELVQLGLKGPLLEAVHEELEVERRFSEQLAHYRRDAVRSLASSAWKAPLVVLFTGVLGALFVFVVAVQLLNENSSFGVSGAFVFALCCVGAGVSWARIHRAWRESRTVETAAEELERFLAIPVEDFDGDDLKSIDRVTQQAELEHVTVQDTNGRKLLENVSVVFKPGILIGVVGSQPIQARALVELLLGFGRPVSGRMLVDGHNVTDLRPDSLTSCGHWVAANGALVTGTVKDNLMGSNLGSADLNETIQATRLTETLSQLPDGLATIITSDDDRLGSDSPFRLGLARASLRNPSVVVIEEPTGGYDQENEQQTLAAMRTLVKHSTISVVLPQRLLTLRQCDLVLLVHNHSVVDSGTHSELLQRNELYRHLNYLRFNPFRGNSDV